MKDQSMTRRIALAGFFIALGYFMPYFTGQIPVVGSMLAPMHIPVLICGFICGPQIGAIVGFLSPVLRSAIAGMPVMFPIAISMSFELAVYGFLAGYLYEKLPKTNINVYISLLLSMLGGRIVWGIASFILFGIAGKPFTFAIFLSGAFIKAVPGIILHIIVVPVVVIALKRYRYTANA